ncbi:MAG TPA: mechanosensitive ion channel domain-containing protein [Candidatus Tectomicrobia bacterium]|nr:mechanosensitive ion channel domain-containing protein [Candidatus Tectomicrobia bacterium]
MTASARLIPPTAHEAVETPLLAVAQAALPEWVGRLGEALSPVVGGWINTEVLLGVRWITLVASLLMLALVGVGDAILRLLVRRKVRRDEARSEVAPHQERETLRWLDRGLRAAVPPLELLLWVHGLHLATSILLIEVGFREEARWVLRGMSWIRSVGTLVGLFWLLFRVSGVVEARLLALSIRTTSVWDRVLIPLAGRTARLTLPLLALIFGAPALVVSPDTKALVRNGVSLVLIGAVAFLLFRLVEALEALVLHQYRVDVADNLQARKVVTQVTVLKKVAIVVIAVFTLASMLMVFESVRQFGTSILASAGIASVIVGFAAQRSIATLLAGFQIALTQPIRIDDVVIVENEWGRIEDITLTYVTVRLWDQRRLIVPITYFIERPFQNWTRTSAELLGTVVLHVDYTVPLGALRQEFARILEASPYWDRKVKVLQVTAAKEHTLEVRALASAADASSAWDLRCEVREKLVEFLQRNHPESLPRLRAELQQMAPRPR